VYLIVLFIKKVTYNISYVLKVSLL